MRGIFAAIKQSLRAIARAKLRAFLTILGILIGVSAVVIVVALGRAVQAKVMGEIATLGANTITIFPQDAQRSGVKVTTRARLTEGDAAAITREAPSVSAVSVVSSTRAQLVSGDANHLTQVIGISEQYLPIMNFVVESGQTFSAVDYRTKAKVVIIGDTVREELFGNGEGIGERVRIGKHPFRVVGVLKKKGQSLFGEDFDDRVMLPIGTFRSRVLPTSPGRVQNIVVTASDEKTVDRAQKQIESILRARHGIDPDDESDFGFRTQAEIRKSNEAIFGALTALLSAIAAISLVVGGIGVMNIMLVSVTERTREIGIRMAIGASQLDIMVQFLVEAVVLTALGGLFGMMVGTLVIFIIGRVLDWTISLPVEALGMAIATSAAIGVVFGFFPARRAARLDPIDALRHE